MLTALKQMKQALPGVAALSQGLRTSAHPATVTTQAVVHCFGANRPGFTRDVGELL
jgi:hypothetical protein